jgi:hypothetical protein
MHTTNRYSYPTTEAGIANNNAAPCSSLKVDRATSACLQDYLPECPGQHWLRMTLSINKVEREEALHPTILEVKDAL